MPRMEVFLRRLAVCAALAGSLACSSEPRSEPPPPSPPVVSAPTPLPAPTHIAQTPVPRPVFTPVAPPTPLATPTPPLRPLPTPTPAATADPSRIAALVAEGERALAEGKLAEADERFGAVLALAPAEARASAGKARVATTRLGLARTFVPDLPSSEADEGPVKSVPGFKELEGMDVRKAVKVPGRAELEAEPERVKPGDSYTVRVYLRNQDAKKKQKLRVVHVNARNTVNGQDSQVEVSWKPLEVKPRERPLVASLSGRWGDDATSWSLVVKVFAEGGDVYENRLVWK